MKKCFHSYLGNDTSDERKKTPKCSKKTSKCPKTGFKASEETFSLVSWQRYVQKTQNDTQIAQKRTTNAIKPVSRPSNKRFCSYLGKGTSDWRKITTKCSKKNGECRNTSFKDGEETFSPVYWQKYIWLTQNNRHITQKRTVNIVKPFSKPRK